MANTVTIANAGTTSDSLEVGSFPLLFCAIETGTFTTADITFQVKGKDAAWKTVYDTDGSAYKITGAVSNGYYPLSPTVFLGATEVRAVTSVAQAQTTTIQFLKKAV